MPKLTPVSHPELVKRLKGLGFDGPYAGGKHLYMVRGHLVLTIPNPHVKDIGIDLLARILRQAGISSKDWTKSK